MSIFSQILKFPLPTLIVQEAIFVISEEAV